MLMEDIMKNPTCYSQIDSPPRTCCANCDSWRARAFPASIGGLSRARRLLPLSVLFPLCLPLSCGNAIEDEDERPATVTQPMAGATDDTVAPVKFPTVGMVRLCDSNASTATCSGCTFTLLGCGVGITAAHCLPIPEPADSICTTSKVDTTGGGWTCEVTDVNEKDLPLNFGSFVVHPGYEPSLPSEADYNIARDLAVFRVSRSDRPAMQVKMQGAPLSPACPTRRHDCGQRNEHTSRGIWGTPGAEWLAHEAIRDVHRRPRRRASESAGVFLGPYG